MTAPDLGFTIFDNTLMQAATCDTKLVLKYRLGRIVQGTNPKLALGSAFHTAKAALAGGTSLEESKALFEQAYKGVADRLDPTDNRLAAYRWDNARQLVGTWLERHQPGAIPDYAVIASLVERPLEAPLCHEEDIRYVGKPDAIAVRNGMLVVDEGKSTGKDIDDPTWRNRWILDSQLTGYIWLVREAAQRGALPTEIRECSGAIVPSLQVRKLNDATTKCRQHGVPYDQCALQEPHYKTRIWGPYERPPEMIAVWRERTLERARRIRTLFEAVQSLGDVPRLDMQGWYRADNECVHCEYLTFCAGGRNPEVIEANTVEQHWDPRHVPVIQVKQEAPYGQAAH